MKIRESTDTLEFYLSFMPQLPLLDREEEVTLARAMHAGDNSARERLILSNLRLVAKEAFRFADRMEHPAPRVDLISYGLEGLMIAVDRFDISRNCKLSTYAVWWIRRCIIRGQNNGGRLIRLPHYIYGVLARVRAVRNKLRGQNSGTDPTDDEMAEALKVDVKIYHRAVNAAIKTSIVGPSASDLFADYPDQTGDSEAGGPTVHELVEVHEQKAAIWRGLYQLDLRALIIVLLRFGIGVSRIYKLDEIGKLLNLSRERIRQIERAALQDLEGLIKVTGG